MKNLLPRLMFFIAAIILISCNNSTFIKQKVTDELELNIPSSFKKTQNVDLKYNLLLEDSTGSMLLMILQESKDTMHHYGMDQSLLNYFNSVSNALKQQLTKGEIANSYEVKINQRNAVKGEIVGSYREELLKYTLLTIETEKNYYQLIAVHPKQHDKRYRETVEQIIQSVTVK